MKLTTIILYSCGALVLCSAFARGENASATIQLRMAFTQDAMVVGPQGPEEYVSIGFADARTGEGGRITCDSSGITSVNDPSKIWNLAAGNHVLFKNESYEFSNHESCYAFYLKFADAGFANLSLDNRSKKVHFSDEGQGAVNINGTERNTTKETSPNTRVQSGSSGRATRQ